MRRVAADRARQHRLFANLHRGLLELVLNDARVAVCTDADRTLRRDRRNRHMRVHVLVTYPTAFAAVPQRAAVIEASDRGRRAYL